MKEKHHAYGLGHTGAVTCGEAVHEEIGNHARKWDLEEGAESMHDIYQHKRIFGLLGGAGRRTSHDPLKALLLSTKLFLAALGTLHVFVPSFDHRMKRWRSNGGNKIVAKEAIQACI